MVIKRIDIYQLNMVYSPSICDLSQGTRPSAIAAFYLPMVRSSGLGILANSTSGHDGSPGSSAPGHAASPAIRCPLRNGAHAHPIPLQAMPLWQHQARRACPGANLMQRNRVATFPRSRVYPTFFAGVPVCRTSTAAGTVRASRLKGKQVCSRCNQRVARVANPMATQREAQSFGSFGAGVSGSPSQGTSRK
jgi:hypothetical protein